MKKTPKPQPERKALYTPDRWGNQLFLAGKNKDKIYLRLGGKGQKRYRLIATIDIANKQLIMVRNYDMHRHLKTNSYCFNAEILRKSEKCTHVLLLETRFEYVRDSLVVTPTTFNNEYVIPIADILANKDYIHHIRTKALEDYELQIYLGMDELQLYKTKSEIVVV